MVNEIQGPGVTITSFSFLSPARERHHEKRPIKLNFHLRRDIVEHHRADVQRYFYWLPVFLWTLEIPLHPAILFEQIKKKLFY